MARDIEPVSAPRINSIPSGLLSLLGLQNGGRYPEWMPNVLQPVLDLTDWYKSVDLEIAAPAANTVAATGNYEITAGGFRVPTNELWWVAGYHVRAVCGAGQAIRHRPAWIPASAAAAGIVGDSATAVASEVAASPSIGEFWALPGSQFIGICEGITAGPVPVTGAIAFKRLRV